MPSPMPLVEPVTMAVLPLSIRILPSSAAAIDDPSHESGQPASGRIRAKENHMKPLLGSWQLWAVLSAMFAALTAIFAKIGVENVNSDLATFIRTIVVVVVLAGILTAAGEWQPPATIAARTYLFLLLSGLGTGASWLCYFRALQLGDAARVAPIDKLSVVLVAIFGAGFLGERLSAINWLGVAAIAGGAVLVAVRG
jgi:transporter family protein